MGFCSTVALNCHILTLKAIIANIANLLPSCLGLDIRIIWPDKLNDYPKNDNKILDFIWL